MDCIVCGKTFIGTNHKCTVKGEKKFLRRLAGQQGADTRSSKRRYGCGETVGDRLQAASNFMKGV